MYESVIGLEIHVELATKTKLFCGCTNRFGGNPNHQVCAVCLGLPGTLPVINKEAINHLLQAALAFDCNIPEKSKFDRKNYFYPDMPKNYQISQYDLPFALQGKVRIRANAGDKTIRLNRIHLEEDTGKSIHVSPQQTGQSTIAGRIGDSLYTLLDYNRAGVPLIEIVTEPDVRSAEEAVLFLEELKLTLETIGVSDCKMEEGSLRCDANVSVRPKGDEKLGVKVEVKNMNSFRSVREAVAHEIERQIKALSNGEKITQETRGWNEDKKFTFSMRSKEEAHDYRYFPEPDLSPFEIDENWLSNLRKSLPALPAAKRLRYVQEHQLTEEEAEFLVGSPALGDFFDRSVKLGAPAREACNWLRGDVSKFLNEQAKEIAQTKLTPELLTELLLLIQNGTISGKIAKEILPEILSEGHSPKKLIESRGLGQISSEEALKALISGVINDPANVKAIEEYHAGKERSFGFLVGAVMKKSQGKANPKIVNELLKEALKRAF